VHGVLPTANLAQVYQELNSSAQKLGLLQQQQRELLAYRNHLKAVEHYRSIVGNGITLVSTGCEDSNASWIRLKAAGISITWIQAAGRFAFGPGVSFNVANVQSASSPQFTNELVEQLIAYVDIEVYRTARRARVFSVARRLLRRFFIPVRNFWSPFVAQRAWYLHHSAHPPTSCPASGMSSMGPCLSPAL